MNKKLIAALSSLLLILPISANAAQLRNNTVAQPTIAILDTALDTSIKSIKDRVVYEACVLQWASCPNGFSEMEGTNSSTLPQTMLSRNGFDHGTQMASIAIQTNPNVNIVFVRIIGNGPTGSRQSTGEQTIYGALDWVIRNQARLNIQAVSISQGHNSHKPGADYCASTPITESKINRLVQLGIPVMVAAGNNRDYSRINWPSCISSAVAVGATMPTKSVAVYSNHDPERIDFYALGTFRATTVGNKAINSAGTSGSAVVAATQWATIKSAKPHLSYSDIYNLISNTSIATGNSVVKNAKLINLEGALNG